MKKFGLTGVAGYVAPRHLRAIKETGNDLIACFDPHDSVGVLDHYFRHADYFTIYERFERHLTKLALQTESKIDYLSVCSPNYLHDSHMHLALNLGSDVICEKPLVLNPKNLDILQELETRSGRKVYTVMQLRNHPSLISLKKNLSGRPDKKHKVDLTYITSRGNWYHHSWKGEEEKSGGIATNIGIHLFDLLIWLFGNVHRSELHLKDKSRMAGAMELKNADVTWFLSIDEHDLPTVENTKGKTNYRSIKVDGKEIEFTEGFTDLHTKVYDEILNGRGLGIDDARPSIEAVYDIRFAKVVSNKIAVHPMIIKER